MGISGALGSQNAMVFSTTNSRLWKMDDYSSSAVLVGNTTAAANTLGTSNLTAQTGNIAATTLLTSSSASSGMFRVSFYIKTTTAGTAGVATTKITVAFNDGAAQTIDVPLLIESAAAPVFLNSHDLGTNNAASAGTVVVYSAASNAITFTTTGTYTGSPQYTLRARIEYLG
jgi:hypothetical protein